MTALLVKAIYDADGNVVALGELAVDDVAQLVGPLAFPDGTIQSTAATGNSGGSGVVSSPTPPDAPTEGQTWFETDSGRSYIWYVNPDTLVGCWIAVSQVDAVGGPQGEPGPQGEVGPTGPQGIQGETGPQGIGLRYVGRVATVSALPATSTHGDVYIADDTGNAHVWNGTTSLWDDAGKITGAAGPQGIQGDAGPAGADSTVQGPQGEVGPQGPAGADGVVGPAGADSQVPGPQGEVGPQGIQGEVGPQGPAGSGGTIGWNAVGCVSICSMAVHVAGQITRGTTYPLGGDVWQLQIVTSNSGSVNNGYAQTLECAQAESATGTWAWWSASVNITTNSTGQLRLTVNGYAIKVAD